MKDLVEYIIKTIVKKPKKVRVKEIPGQGFTTIEIKADQDDLGQIIGKKGRIIKALQMLTQIRGLKESKRCFLKIVDLKEGVRPTTT